jgi:hypothetical protein
MVMEEEVVTVGGEAGVVEVEAETIAITVMVATTAMVAEAEVVMEVMEEEEAEVVMVALEVEEEVVTVAGDLVRTAIIGE